MTAVIIFIILGILLFVIEFLLVPGLTIAGIGGLILTVLGVYKAFSDFGPQTGYWVLAITLLVSLFVIVLSLRARTWNRLMLKTNIEGSVDETAVTEQISVGDQGTALTRLAPMGKIKVNKLIIEATSIEGYVNENSAIEVVTVEAGKITVKTIKS